MSFALSLIILIKYNLDKDFYLPHELKQKMSGCAGVVFPQFDRFISKIQKSLIALHNIRRECYDQVH